jgi:hypothetical protein
MTSADQIMTESEVRSSGNGVRAAAPVVRPGMRRHGWRGNEALGIAWLHGTLQATVFRRQAAGGSWASPTPIHTVEEFEAALDVALKALEFSGAEVFLVLEHDLFVHQAEYAPAFSDSAARAYLRGRIERYEKEREPVLWISQRTVSARQEAAFLLHLLPSAFYGRLNGCLLARRLDLTRILPLVVPLQLILESGSTPKDQPVLVVAEAGDATTLMVSRANGELVFARTMLARWDSDSERIAVEVNRSLLYAKQQFGAVVEHIQLLGAVVEKAQADVRARCGANKQVTVRSTNVVDWLQAVARLSQRHPVNLVVGYVGRKRRKQFLRRALLAGCWLGFGLMTLKAWSRAGDWREERHRLASLEASQVELNTERTHLEQRNAAVAHQSEIIRQTVDQRLPAVPARFLAYLGGVRPPEIQFNDFSTKWDPATEKWTFRLEGQIEGDEDLARESLAAFQKLLVKGPLRARFNDAVRTLVVVSSVGSEIPAPQRFSVEGGLFED